ncbi:MAG: UDP-N-acetylglucosamine diphosphorylase [candidate division KSB1 bacterium]|nr:UDP-N-acetylglucosamine diphosphorylase [candidate division KSB1 bacterium]
MKIHISRKNNTLSASALFDLSKCPCRSIFDDAAYVWEAVAGIAAYLNVNLKSGIQGNAEPGARITGDVYIGENTIVEDGAVIRGPVWIGNNCRVFASAFIRENVIIGSGARIGGNTEIKNSILFDEAVVPHFNYVGDSILGWRAHLGAGVKTANVRLDGQAVWVKDGDRRIATGLRKLGAIIGDEAEIGCNAVLNPGTIIGVRTIVYAGALLSGIYPPDSIVKVRQHHEIVKQKK